MCLLTTIGIDPEITRAIALAWERARDATHLPQRVLAHALGIGGPQLADQLAGRGGAYLALPRIERLARSEDADVRRFHDFFQHELRLARGDDSEPEWLQSQFKWLLLKFVDSMQRKVPVKADLRETRDERIA